MTALYRLKNEDGGFKEREGGMIRIGSIRPEYEFDDEEAGMRNRSILHVSILHVSISTKLVCLFMDPCVFVDLGVSRGVVAKTSTSSQPLPETRRRGE
ncbi:hypothetical protein Bca52824_047328 [Brassica carinata]|uniref:Uncharacterized protein n=1 Tax=Brassica carinata TaxID=52824 RepID=A0A8X7RLQ8_BRACI|nr:hypothetical protein Bca52824_047328 [Brassica carinata]